MTNSENYNLYTIRSRIHGKSREYFTSSRWNNAKRNMFYGATDALLDATQAAHSYSITVAAHEDSKLLACYGFLQALYVQQDAVLTLSRAMEISWDPNNNERLKEIRDTRNRLTGHPAKAGRSSHPSSAIIPYHDITPSGFRGHVYYADGGKDITVDADQFIKINETHLSHQLLVIESRMDEEEREFRTSESALSFTACFKNGFDYLLERLSCDLNNYDRLVQAQTHATMIQCIMTDLDQKITDRGFAHPEISRLIRTIQTGLSLLEGIMLTNQASNDDQHKFDVIHSGIETHIRSLRSAVAEIDRQLNRPISSN